MQNNQIKSFWLWPIFLLGTFIGFLLTSLSLTYYVNSWEMWLIFIGSSIPAFILLCLIISLGVWYQIKNDKKLQLMRAIKNDIKSKMTPEQLSNYQKMRDCYQQELIFGKKRKLLNNHDWKKSQLLTMNNEIFKKLLKNYKVKNVDNLNREELINIILK